MTKKSADSKSAQVRQQRVTIIKNRMYSIGYNQSQAYHLQNSIAPNHISETVSFHM